ncbi:MAG: hypothetical protein GXP38_08975 [Chloroflexi bacterium]|nr:hypothetical protein [Chloroflexota bacterium]
MTFLFSSDHTSITDELLSAYIDGEVTSAEKQRVEQALREHADLRRKLVQMQQTVAFLAELESVPVPRAFVLSEAQVLAAGGRVRSTRNSGFWARLIPRLMPLATAAVAVALLVVLGLDFFSPSAQPLATKSERVQVAEAPVVEVTKEVEAVALAPPVNATAEALSESAEALPRVEKEVAPAAQALGAQALPEGESASDEDRAVPALEQEQTAQAPSAPEVSAEESTASEAMPASPPEVEPSSDRFRALEWLLAGLLVILASLTVWSRRRIQPK